VNFIQKLQQHTPAVCYGDGGVGYGINKEGCYTGHYWELKKGGKVLVRCEQPTSGVSVRIVGAPAVPCKESRKEAKSVLSNDGLFIPLNVVSFKGA